MSWEICHSPEAWDNVRANLGDWTREELLRVLGACRWSDVYDASGSDEHATKAQEAYLARITPYASTEALVESVVEQIERHNTCSNGGHEFYIDREGYETVSCSREEPEPEPEPESEPWKGRKPHIMNVYGKPCRYVRGHWCALGEAAIKRWC